MIKNILPLIEAVLVQLYIIANSPKTLPELIVHNTFDFLVTSKLPP